MPLLQPRAVLHVRLPARHRLELARIDEDHLEPAPLQQLEQGNPGDAGRFHRHRPHAALLQPVGQLLEVFGKSPEPTYRLGVSPRGNGHEMKLAVEIHPRRIGRHHTPLRSLPQITLGKQDDLPSREQDSPHQKP